MILQDEKKSEGTMIQQATNDEQNMEGNTPANNFDHPILRTGHFIPPEPLPSKLS